MSHRQGVYSSSGDIVVLCAYLGQLSKVRASLEGLVTVVVDERDEIALARAEDGEEPLLQDTTFTQSAVKNRVCVTSGVCRSWVTHA
jgi:hypothetical protein